MIFDFDELLHSGPSEFLDRSTKRIALRPAMCLPLMSNDAEVVSNVYFSSSEI